MRVVRWLLALHIDRLLLLALDSLHLLLANFFAHAFSTRPTNYRHVDWLDDEDGLFDHGLAILQAILHCKPLEFLICYDFVLNWALVVHVLHHVEKDSRLELRGRLVSLGDIVGLSSRTMGSIEVVGADRHFLPIKTCLVHIIVCARVLGHNRALCIFESDLRLGCRQLAGAKRRITAPGG